MNLPQQFIENMKVLFKDDFQNYIKSFEEERVYGLRVNTLKISSSDFVKKKIFDLSEIRWCSDGFYYNVSQRPAKHPYYHAGLYYLQEPSAMAPVSVFNIEQGDRVLDLCAAPGGKSTAIGARLKGKGILVSNDISASRAKALLKNIEIFGIKNAVVTCENPKKLKNKFKQFFNKILVDAPCSGEGMFRKEPDIIKSWNDTVNDDYAVIQKDILNDAAEMLEPGGYILYSTCTFSKKENEEVIDCFLNSHDDFEVLPIDESYGFEKGFVEENNIKNCRRLLPYKIKGEGHFLALLHNKSYIDKKKNIKVFKKVKDERFKYFEEFKDINLNCNFEGEFCIINDFLYLLPELMPDLSGIRILRSGWLLGEFKKNRFEPSQALAMGLLKQECKNIIDFKLNDINVLKYLKGETIDGDFEGSGYRLINVDGFPLGWAKVQNGRLKNKYISNWKLE